MDPTIAFGLFCLFLTLVLASLSDRDDFLRAMSRVLVGAMITTLVVWFGGWIDQLLS